MCIDARNPTCWNYLHRHLFTDHDIQVTVEHVRAVACEKIMAVATERGENFKVGSRVAFTTPRDSSNVLSLEKLDDDEGGTDGGEAAEQGDQATKSA